MTVRRDLMFVRIIMVFLYTHNAHPAKKTNKNNTHDSRRPEHMKSSSPPLKSRTEYYNRHKHTNILHICCHAPSLNQ